MRSALELARLAAPALGIALAAACSGTHADPEPVCDPNLSYESFAGPFFLDWCTGCHSSSIAEEHRQEAPAQVNFDSLDGILLHRDSIVARAVETHSMPPAGGPSEEERKLLEQWFACGAPHSANGFTPPAPPPSVPEPEPSGACSAPRQPLPRSILPRCSAMTYDCVQRCALEQAEADVDDCREACQAADATPPDTSLGYAIDCSGCVFAELLACGEASGCHDSVAALMCCVTDCAESGDATCIERECTGEITAFGYCVYYQGPDCIDYGSGALAACFAR